MSNSSQCISKKVQCASEVELSQEKVVLSYSDSSQVELRRSCQDKVKYVKNELLSNGVKNVVEELSEGCMSVQGMVELFEVVNGSGLPNFQGCRIPVPASKKFNMNLWRDKLVSYEDKVICEYLEFGFPLDFNSASKLNYDVRRNHKGARDFAEFIDSYLERECQNLRVVGPFKKNPLSKPIMVSPMNSVPKANDDERRVIVDLSWPHGMSVNDGISKDVYMGEIIDLHYASVKQVCEMVLRVGVGSVIYKRDMRRAYRQIPVDPGDYCYLGYHWGGAFFFDTVLCMGQRNAAMACSRTTKAIMHMHEQEGHLGTSYLDDLIGVSPPADGVAAYESLGELLVQLGVLENFTKACPPLTVQIVLGVLIDTVNGTIAGYKWINGGYK